MFCSSPGQDKACNTVATELPGADHHKDIETLHCFIAEMMNHLAMTTCKYTLESGWSNSNSGIIYCVLLKMAKLSPSLTFMPDAVHAGHSTWQQIVKHVHLRDLF